MIAAKICGLCRPEDAAAAAAAGARYAGVVLAPGRVRTQSLVDAARILEAAGTLRRVGVFVNPTLDAVVKAAEQLRLDVVQLHGAESVELVEAVRAAGSWSVWKAVPVTAAADEALVRYGGAADGMLLDGGAGGEGVAFEWSARAHARELLPPGCTLVVAGGLNPHNVTEAMRLLVPDVVDVSSGVETSPGVKSAAAIRAFVAATRSVGRGIPNLESK